jgi:hypothetical protein
MNYHYSRQVAKNCVRIVCGSTTGTVLVILKHLVASLQKNYLLMNSQLRHTGHGIYSIPYEIYLNLQKNMTKTKKLVVTKHTHTQAPRM